MSEPGHDEMDEAKHLVSSDRNQDYGPPHEDFAGVAKIWSGLLSWKLTKDITPEEAALMMAALKIRRQFTKRKRDNMVDAHGYLIVAAHCRAARS